MMANLTIKDDDLAILNAKVVIITGGSSGIGLAAARILVRLGAKVVIGDLQPPREELSDEAVYFQRTDVTEWKDLCQLFKAAKRLHGRIDHVFANAGVSPKADYLSLAVDEDGCPREPVRLCEEVNLRGCINTAALGIFHMRPEQQGQGGSIVVTASIASFTHFRGVDYSELFWWVKAPANSGLASSKHGTLGFMRGMHSLLSAEDLPIRINAIAPSWTSTGLVPEDFISQLGVKVQSADAAAMSALILMADKRRNGQLMHSVEGRYKEVEESIFVPAAIEVTGREGPSEDEILGKAMALMGGRYDEKV